MSGQIPPKRLPSSGNSYIDAREALVNLSSEQRDKLDFLADQKNQDVEVYMSRAARIAANRSIPIELYLDEQYSLMMHEQDKNIDAIQASMDQFICSHVELKSPNDALIEQFGPYSGLKRVFDQAFTSQTEGKSKARHNKTGILPFEQQRIMTISETINSPHGLTYQVTKKMLEALDMPEIEKTIHELQGAMVYLGALILYVERQELKRTKS